MKITGSLTISSWTGGKAPGRGIRIEIKDVDACAIAVEVELTHEQLALALTGLGCIPCEVDFNNSGVIGKKSENKTEIVPFKNEDFLREGPKLEALMSKALAPFEVNGWEAYRPDLLNGHRRVDGGYRVTFFRHVKKTGGGK